MFEFRYILFSSAIFFSVLSFSVYACTEGPNSLVNCYGCETPEDIAEAIEEEFPAADYLDVGFTTAQFRVVIYERVMGRWMVVGRGSIPIDKSCGQEWLDAVEGTDLIWPLLDLVDNSSDGDSGPYVPPGLGLGGGGLGFGSGPITCVYTNGVGNSDNHSSCPPTNFPGDNASIGP